MTMLHAEPEMLCDYACETGEGPLWHPQEQRLYWVDIPAGRLFRYDPATNHHELCLDTGGDAIGGFTVQADGGLLLFMSRGAIRTWHNGTISTIHDEIPAERDTRFNDVIADPAGRVFGGTMVTPQRSGQQYRVDTDGSLHVVMDDVLIPNGMGFTPDRRAVYFTDSRRHTISLFDYDEATGAITNQRPFVSVPDSATEGIPDGMTVDAAGNVWSARWDGSCLVRYAPDGVETGRVLFPVKKVSSVTFGGPDYTDMYVTTAGGNVKDTDGVHAGALYRVRLGIRGVPEFYSRVRL